MALVLLAIPNLVAGVWAVVSPRSWFDEFPGWAPQLVAALPPYNEHLATDAGAGLLTVGVLAAYAAFRLHREVVVVASLGVLTFSLPHTIFHLLNPADSMTASEDAVNSATLVIGTALAAAVLVVAARTVPGHEKEVAL